MKNIKIGDLNSYVIEPEEGAKNIVVLLHGYGASGRDLIGIGDEWKNALPNTIFISPDAPFPCEMAPAGLQWYSLNEYTIPAMEREIVGAWPVLNQYLDAVLKHYGLGDDKMIISGFSQGCMMSLYALPRRKNACAGILGYSGRLLGASALNGANKTTPIYLIHGEADDVVDRGSWDDATETLETRGYKVSGYTTPRLGHGIDGDGIANGLKFIQSCF
ncbi:MAG: phospholipase [Alphaproteobacteria bacterium]|nr:MAG: phospholipase [Alphaproteobacteria bacterium]